MSHRGPDGEGFFEADAGRLALGHRRLSILDLRALAAQPMRDASGRFTIVFNGEIYNFVELRRTLESEGYSFRTDSDTEVVLAAFDRWGAECQLRFNGMWALAIWDERERRLFLSRDRFGVKPLHYVMEPQRFAFASELKAFLHLDGFSPERNDHALRAVLANAFQLEGSPETLLKGVKRLPPGHCLEMSDRGLAVTRWWRTTDHLETPPRGLDAQAERFRELFFDSCRIRLRSDVPIGTSLSGGLDSSSVLCTIAKLARQPDAIERRAPDWQRAIVATFPGSALDERAWAQVAGDAAGLQPEYVPITTDLLPDEVDRLIYDLEDVYLGLPASPWATYRALRASGVVVSLDGHGADELLAGYGNYLFTALQHTGGLLSSPLRIFSLLRTLRAMYHGSANARPSMISLLADTDPILNFVRRHTRGMRSPGEGEASAWLPLDEVTFERPVEDPEAAKMEPITRHLYRDFHEMLLPTILRNFDRSSMAHGVEVRMPFMDWRLVCFVFSLPDSSKVSGGYTKRVLREALRGVLPESIRCRRGKIGFGAPLDHWLRGPLAPWLQNIVTDPEFIESPLWDGPQIRRYVTDRSSQGWTWTEAQKVWPFLHAHAWTKAFLRKQGQRALAS